MSRGKSSHSATGKLGMVLLVAAASVVGAGGCGGVKTSRADAREKATKATCDRYAKCDAIGPGLSYEDRESCEIAWESIWDSAWPIADCEGRIDKAAFDTCINRIDSTTCDVLDVFRTLDLCAKKNVCIGAAPDAATGG
jgi:hypothetical protein